MKFLHHLTCAMLIVCSLHSISQSTQLDSLKSALEATDDVDLKIETLAEITDQFQNPNDKLIYSRLAYRLSVNASPKSKIIASNEMGICHGMLGVLDSSRFYFSKALEASLELGDSTYISSAYNGLGNLARINGNLDEALENFLNALDFAGAVKNKRWAADIMTNISGVYFDLKNFDAALEKVLEARNLYDENNDKDNMSYTANLLSILYRALGDLDLSYQYNQEALEMLLISQDTGQIIYNYVNSTNILIEQKKLDEAASFAQKTIKMAEEFGDKDPQITSLLTLSSIYYRQGKINAASSAAKQAIAIAEESEFRAQLPNAYMINSLIEASKGNYKQAFELSKLHESMNDSVRSSEIADKISELSVQYETEKKENEIERLNAEQEIKNLELSQANTRNTYLTILAIFFVFVGIVILYLYQQRVKINKQLEAVNQTKDRLFSMIAHDIKNPLSAFKSIASTLEENYKSMEEDQVEMFISQLDSSSNKLLDLLQNLLEWSITQTGALRYHPEKISLNEVVSDAIDLFQGVIDGKKLEVNNNIPNQSNVEADYKMVFSVVRNLISNAVKFTPKGGSIDISSSTSGGLMEIVVSDTGNGMTSDQVNQLFEKNSPTSKDGTGLGLILCKEFVEKNGGTIKVESEQGIGTKFKFTLKSAA